MFFSDSRAQFFKPLTSKYREVMVECLRLLYLRLYSTLSDYGHNLDREQLIDVFQEALTRAPVLEGQEDESLGRFRSDRELAGWILNQLVEYGWLERQLDEATLQSTFGFTRHGRLFTQPFVDTDASRLRTRHRNTRNTRNALDAFAQQGEIHDLLDAFEYSERIISDFTDVIAELDERKRQLVQEVEAQVLVQRATEEFFEFMEKRFQPDIAIRLSADSVEKYREDIVGLVQAVKRKPKEFKADAERALRRVMPSDLLAPGQSYLFFVLDSIENRLRSACDIMLPALRRSMQSFTQRADIIIRQMSYLTSQRHNNTVALCQALAELPADEQDQWLLKAGERMTGVRVGLIDPAHVQLQESRRQREVYTAVEVVDEIDQEGRKELYIQQLLDRAFTLTNQEMRRTIVEALGNGRRISTRHIPVRSVRDLLTAAHAIELGSDGGLSSEFRFRITPLAGVVNNDYFDAADEFEIELVSSSDAAASTDETQRADSDH